MGDKIDTERERHSYTDSLYKDKAVKLIKEMREVIMVWWSVPKTNKFLIQVSISTAIRTIEFASLYTPSSKEVDAIRNHLVLFSIANMDNSEEFQLKYLKDA